MQISAEVNKTQVALDDQIVLAVTVMGPQASLPEPQMPPLPNFSVYSSGRSQNISFVNGKVASSVVHTFLLVPRFVGKGTIEPISVSAQGTKVQTQPIEIQVLPPGSSQKAAPPQQLPAARPQGPTQAPDVFVTAEVDKARAYVNQQVTLSVRFYTAVNLLGNPQYNAPKTSGFISEDLPPERHGNTVFKGRTYYYSEIKTALFPAQAGRLSIGAALVRCQVQQDLTVDPFAPDFFERFFSRGLGGAQTREPRSEPLLVEALPLPEAGKPEDFSGAVGKFSVSAAVDRTRARVGEAVNLTVTVEGTGNLKVVGDPKLPRMDSLRAYETVSSLNLDKKGDLVRGSKVFKTVLVPRVSGDLTLPAISFSYFDPEQRAFRAAQTLPILIRVAPGEGGASAPAAPAAPQGLATISEDIRYLKARTSPPLAVRALEAVAGAGGAHAIPFLVFAACLALAGLRELGEADPAGRRFRRAFRSASARMKSAARSGSDPGQAAGLLSEALSVYLADKLGEPPAGLTLRRVQELLRQTQPQIGPKLLERIRALWEELDLLRFAPGASGGDLSRETLELLKELEKEIRRP